MRTARIVTREVNDRVVLFVGNRAMYEVIYNYLTIYNFINVLDFVNKLLSV